MSLVNKVQPKIQKVINRFPTKAKVYRETLDKYGEELTELFICDITGFYHQESGNGRLQVNIADKGEVIRNKPGEYLMILINPETSVIQKNDTLYLCDSEGNQTSDKYEITDLGDLNRMGIYYDLNLRRI